MIMIKLMMIIMVMIIMIMIIMIILVVIIKVVVIVVVVGVVAILLDVISHIFNQQLTNFSLQRGLILRLLKLVYYNKFE